MSLDPVTSAYSVRVRDSSGNLAGQITTYRKVSINKRYNNISSWAIELDAADPVAALLIEPQYGISITRNVYSAKTGELLSSRVEIEGKTYQIERSLSSSNSQLDTANTLVIAGMDDMGEVYNRLAWPVVAYYYDTNLLNSTLNPGLKRYFKLAETSGTVVTDSAGIANATYHGSPLFSQLGGLDDPGTAVLFNGSSQYITSSTLTGLSTGNNPWTIAIWVNLVNFPASGNAYIMEYGTDAAKSAALLYVSAAGSFFATGTAWGDTGNVALTLGQWYYVGATWDGTTLTAYLNGAVVGTPTTPGAMTIGSTGLSIGSNLAGTANWANMYAMKGQMHNVCLTPAEMAADYALGASRFAAFASDDQTGPAESVINHYVDNNAGPDAFSERQVSWLAVATGSNRGSTVSATARFDKMLTLDNVGLLQQLALLGGDLGFRIRRIAGVRTFEIYQGNDKTATAIFSQALNNLLDFDYVLAAPTPDTGGNTVIVGGAGDGAAQIIRTITDTNSDAQWGRIEYFQVASNLTDPDDVIAQANSLRLITARNIKFSAMLTQIPQMVYAVDFDLGDDVTAIIDGNSFQDKIREVDITLDPTAPLTETVVLQMGTPGAQFINDAAAAYRRTIQRQIDLMRTLLTG